MFNSQSGKVDINFENLLYFLEIESSLSLFLWEDFIALACQIKSSNWAFEKNGPPEKIKLELKFD